MLCGINFAALSTNLHLILALFQIIVALLFLFFSLLQYNGFSLPSAELHLYTVLTEDIQYKT